MDSYNRGAAGPPKPFSEARAGALPPPPPSPPGRVGVGWGGVNQSCLTAPLSDDTCQNKKVNAIDERVASEWHEGGMAWHGMEWHGMASFILDI